MGHYDKFKQIEAAIALERIAKPEEKISWEINEVKRHQETSVILAQRILGKLLAAVNQEADSVESTAEVKQVADILRILVDVEKSLAGNIEATLKTASVHSYLHRQNAKNTVETIETVETETK